MQYSRAGKLGVKRQGFRRRSFGQGVRNFREFRFVIELVKSLFPVAEIKMNALCRVPQELRAYVQIGAFSKSTGLKLNHTDKPSVIEQP